MRGLLGGTFDPPHIGHLVLSLCAMRLYDLQEVLLVPSRYPPHKTGCSISPFSHRLEMIRLTALDHPGLRAADLEDKSGPSWTVDLLRRLSKDGENICFIMGMDSLRDLFTWKNPNELSRYARLVAGTRPGFSGKALPAGLLRRVETFAIPSLAVSSSDLRDRFARGLDTRYLVPESVRHYIEGNGLYEPEEGN